MGRRCSFARPYAYAFSRIEERAALPSKHSNQDIHVEVEVSQKKSDRKALKMRPRLAVVRSAKSPASESGSVLARADKTRGSLHTVIAVVPASPQNGGAQDHHESAMQPRSVGASDDDNDPPDDFGAFMNILRAAEPFEPSLPIAEEPSSLQCEGDQGGGEPAMGQLGSAWSNDDHADDFVTFMNILRAAEQSEPSVDG
jgi:hypothetical protein